MRFLPVAFAAALLVGFFNPLSAQQSNDPRIALTGSAGVTLAPNTLVSRCSPDGFARTPSVELSSSLVARVWSHIVVQGDLRWAKSPTKDNCSTYSASAGTSYALTSDKNPFSSSTVRVGLETAPSRSLLRATVGIGRVWGSPTLPLTVVGLATGTRGPGVRFLLELEWLKARLPAETRYPDGLPSRISVPATWTSARAGVAIPLRR